MPDKSSSSSSSSRDKKLINVHEGLSVCLRMESHNHVVKLLKVTKERPATNFRCCSPLTHCRERGDANGVTCAIYFPAAACTLMILGWTGCGATSNWRCLSEADILPGNGNLGGFLKRNSCWFPSIPWSLGTSIRGGAGGGKSIFA